MEIVQTEGIVIFEIDNDKILSKKVARVKRKASRLYLPISFLKKNVIVINSSTARVFSVTRDINGTATIKLNGEYAIGKTAKYNREDRYSVANLPLEWGGDFCYTALKDDCVVFTPKEE